MKIKIIKTNLKFYFKRKNTLVSNRFYFVGIVKSDIKPPKDYTKFNVDISLSKLN